MQEASEYICILLKEHNEEMLPKPDCVWSHNQHLHVCECVKERRIETELSTVRQAVRRVCVPSEVYFCLMFRATLELIYQSST